MNPKNSNLRFLLSLGATKMVVLQDEESLHIYANEPRAKTNRKSALLAEHVTEALAVK